MRTRTVWYVVASGRMELAKDGKEEGESIRKNCAMVFGTPNLKNDLLVKGVCAGDSCLAMAEGPMLKLSRDHYE